MARKTMSEWIFCRSEARHLLSPYIDGELSKEQGLKLEEHLENCTHCRETHQNLLFAKKAVKLIDIPEIQSPPGLPVWLLEKDRRQKTIKKIQPGWKWIFAGSAAAGFAALIIGIFLHFGANITSHQSGENKQERIEIIRLAGKPIYKSKVLTNSGWLEKGETIETDNDSKVLLKIGNIGQVETDVNTRIDLLAARSDEQRLSLKRGKIYATITAPPRVFFVNTLAATAIDLGCAYTLEVTAENESILEVTSGWVALANDNREELVPAGTVIRARPQTGAGTPYLKDSAVRFQEALNQFDFGGEKTEKAEAVKILLDEARANDGITLWYLFKKVGAEQRSNIFEKLNRLIPLPNNLSKTAILNLDEKQMQEWLERINYASLGINPKTVNFDTGSLTLTGSLHAPRIGHTATLLSSNKILIAGGWGENGKTLADAEIYDPATKISEVSASMINRRVGHTATLLRNGKVLLAGGSERDPFVGAQQSAEIYDPVTGLFTLTGSMHYPRLSHQATLLPDGKVLITGGIIEDKTGNPEAELYDPDTGQFTQIEKLIYPRFDHTATLLKTGEVLIAGGARTIDKEIEILDKSEIYNPKSQTFRETGLMIASRHKHSAELLPNGEVLILGGSDRKLWNGKIISAEVYDPVKETFAQTGQMQTARYKIRDAVALLKNNKILVAGGGEHLEIYDPQTGIFVQVKSSLNAARFSSTATLLNDGRVILIGGYSEVPDQTGIRLLPDAGIWSYQP